MAFTRATVRSGTAVVIAGEKADNLGEDGSLLRRFEGLTPGQAHYDGPNDLPILHALRAQLT